ncbi:ABC transporter permease [Streptomyces caniscabiei]|uniref:ABC transporter permease n=1 Tax=Streptomyces caniscabiei TaxID=2746961 RepID=A0A927L5P2_9ACTN|nr:ABC transporter permease [Streptomyces caniscabiei]MBD9726025.1 ABC transporter permease [Streptomyces caniscabiei]MDX3507748.1 ABC transporter permease [Streptomyces caniscabiei]MDX3717710.1 ABC transporter permease [Streptomyces caniscabiei]WEO25453.1 ABC transporter permease [Streptomyces caniscabiei]
MTTWFHSWRAAVRIARRDAWRSKGRSFLVLAMIALPILGVSALDLTLRSAELTPAQRMERTLGAADARFSDAGAAGVAILQDPAGEQHTPAGDYDSPGKSWPDGPTDVTKSIPAGSTVLTDSRGSAKLTTRHGLLQAEVRELAAGDPVARGIMRVQEGRFPEKNDEIAATTQFLESSGLSVGSTLTARGFDRTYVISGSYELPSDLKAQQVNALPGAFLAPYAKAVEKAGLPKPEDSTTYLVKKSGGFTWNTVQAINAKGVLVTSRAVALHPPADSEVPLYQKEGWANYESGGTDAAALAAVGTVVGLAMLEICLLAGPAFAVGARRSRRQLGLVGANGGARSHIRAIVLSGGLVIGVAAALVGMVLALVLTFALRPLLEDYMGQRFGGFTVRPLELLAIAALAILTGVLSAIVPAVTASRQTVLASLTGRRGVRRSNRVLPLIGFGAVLLGAAIALYGSVVSDQFVLVAGGSAIAELGVVAMTPALVGLFGRASRWLPLSPRLALRDAVRNRGRTAPAVAAVLAAVAGTVAVSTYAASSDAQSQAEYRAGLPYGAVAALVTEEGGRDVPEVRDAVQRTLPVDVRADVFRIAVGKPGCAPYDEGEGCGRFEVVTPPANECPLWVSTPDGSDPAEKYSKEQRRALAKDWRCLSPDGNGIYVDGGLLIADAPLLKVLGIDDPGAAKALADGKLLSFHKPQVDRKGAVGIKLITDPKAADRAAQQNKPVPGELKSFPAYQVPGSPDSYGVQSVLSPAAAKAAGLTTVPLGAFFSTDRIPSTEERQKLDAEIAKLGSNVELTVEQGWVDKNGLVLLALTVFAGLVTIGAAGIATGLAQADAEADLKTLAAVGAPPRVRRMLSGFQCGVVAAMGVVLGSAAGVLPAVGLRLTEERQQMRSYQEALDSGWGGAGDAPPYVPIIVPWETLAALLVAVPLGAAVLAALVTRSRGALARRAAH